MKRFLTGFLSTCSTAPVPVFFVSCHSNGTAGNSADGAADTTAVRLQLVTGDVPFPVQMLAAPDTSQRLFITDLGGRIMILKNGTVSPKPFADISALLETKIPRSKSKPCTALPSTRNSLPTKIIHLLQRAFGD